MGQDEVVNSALAKALIANAQDLGISWNLRIATVMAMVPGPLQGRTVNAVFDGDSVPITMTNMTGVELPVGTRVYVIMITTLGNFIVGFADVAAYSLFGYVASGGTLAQSNGAEAAIPALTWAVEPVAKVRPHWIARVSVYCSTFVNTATDSVMIIRVRNGSGTTVGTQVCGWRVDASSATTTVASQILEAYVVNGNSTRTSAQTLSLTIQTGNGAAIMGLYADATLPTVVACEEVCPVNANLGLASIAGALGT